MAQGRSHGWVPVAFLAAGIALAVACGGGSSPPKLPPDLAGCKLEHITVTASELNERDGCTLRLRCGSTKVETSCDGENDGTNTSLCDCTRDGVRDEHALTNAYQGEAPDACLAAAVHCRAPRGQSPKLVD